MMSFMIWWLLWLSFRQGFTMKMGWNEELEFCEEEWKKFVADKIEIDSKCNNTRTRCFVEEKKYLLERFKMFSETCSLEGTCGCSPIILNFTARLFPKDYYFAFAKWKEPEDFTCSHKFINETIEKSYLKPFGRFWLGQHNIPYKYVLYGGKTHTCYVVINVNLRHLYRDTNGFFIKNVQSGMCVTSFVSGTIYKMRISLVFTMDCFDRRVNLKFLQSGSILELYTNTCLVRHGNGVRLVLPYRNFIEECRAINAITQTTWGGLFYSRYNKCIVATGSHFNYFDVGLANCKKEENQRFNFGKLEYSSS
ncbi:uncharacterized protein LOC124452171 [Xenia sp. Carnegie-2017]|uniref:uncharacterized protein LOC124452171 n=1 Tax=Xenia sp. Carnegie-2017 TaxID=2897299 RepID=UPI001F04622E|nr:uncharacterized protein LOC124452171 [Xenia sp. Carnegie-2017]